MILKRSLMILFALSVVGCGTPEREQQSATTKEPEKQQSAQPQATGERVALTMAPTLKGGTLTIAGTTDLPDGALLAFEVQHQDALQHMAEGQIEVKNGRYSTEINVNDWPRGTIDVWVAFQTILGNNAKQSQGVIDRFGQMGENLTGSNVVKAGTMNRVEVTAMVRR